MLEAKYLKILFSSRVNNVKANIFNVTSEDFKYAEPYLKMHAWQI